MKYLSQEWSFCETPQTGLTPVVRDTLDLGISRMTRRHVIPGIIAAPQALGQSPQLSIRKRLIGVWKLLTIEVGVDGKIVLPYGEHPLGRLTYDEAGRTSAQVMKPGRRSSVADPSSVSRANEDDLRQIADGYVGYYGTFTIDEGTLVHHIEACTLPAWVGTDQKRQYEFAGGQLVLKFGTTKLVWERLSD
jgi:hypothetical protein